MDASPDGTVLVKEVFIGTQRANDDRHGQQRRCLEGMVSSW